VLANLSPFVAPGAILLLNTTNADSLAHLLLRKQWEGYFDYTHYGVDRVSVRSLREGLPHLGWRIEYLATQLVWGSNVDPIHATLRDWRGDARFRRLLAELKLGDLIVCVAFKE